MNNPKYYLSFLLVLVVMLASWTGIYYFWDKQKESENRYKDQNNLLTDTQNNLSKQKALLQEFQKNKTEKYTKALHNDVIVAGNFQCYIMVKNIGTINAVLTNKYYEVYVVNPSSSLPGISTESLTNTLIKAYSKDDCGEINESNHSFLVDTYKLKAVNDINLVDNNISVEYSTEQDNVFISRLITIEPSKDKLYKIECPSGSVSYALSNCKHTDLN